MSSGKGFELVLLYGIADLLVRSRLETSVGAKRKTISSIGSLAELDTTLQEDRNALIVCDAVVSKLELSSLCRIASSHTAKVMAYYPHVNKNLAEVARGAGVDYLITRSALERKLNELLKE